MLTKQSADGASTAQPLLLRDEAAMDITLGLGDKGAFKGACRLTPFFSVKGRERVVTAVASEAEYMAYIKETQYACEALDGGPVKAYLDVDAKVPVADMYVSVGADGRAIYTERDSEGLLARVRKAIERVPLFAGQHYVAMTREKRLIDSGRTVKVSWRFVFPKLIVSEPKALGAYLKAIGCEPDKPFDLSVYNRGRIMNAVYCTKPPKEGEDACPPLDPLLGWGGLLEDRLITVVDPALPIVNMDEWMPKPAEPAPVKTPSLTREGSIAGSDGGDDVETARKLLTLVNADCAYDKWLQVLCVLRDVIADEDLAEDLADNWSRTAPARYDSLAFRRTWRSVKRTGAYSLGTLVMRAREENPDGYAELFPQRRNSESAPEKPINFFAHFQTAIMTLPENKRTYAVVKRAFEQQYFKLREGGDTYGFHKWDLSGECSFVLYDEGKLKKMNREVYYWAEGKKENVLERHSFMDTWLGDTFKRYYDYRDFVPPPLSCPDNVLNTFTGFAAEALPASGKECVTDEDVAPFIGHLNVLTDGDERATAYLLSWFAQILQQPGKLAGTYVIFGGSEGAGKSFITRFVGEKLIGDRYFYTTDNAERDIFGRFSNGRIDKLLLNFEEAKQLHKYYDNLKDIVTSTRTPFEQKGVMSETRRVYNRVVMTTNNRFPITVDQTDRRVVAVWASRDKCNDREYFKGLGAWCEDPVNVRLVYEYLMARNIADVDFVKDRPTTVWCNDMKMRSLKVSHQFLLWLREEMDGEEVTVLTSTALMTQYKRWSAETNQKAELTGTALGIDIKTVGGEHIKVPGGTSGKSDRGYRLSWAVIRENIGA